MRLISRPPREGAREKTQSPFSPHVPYRAGGGLALAALRCSSVAPGNERGNGRRWCSAARRGWPRDWPGLVGELGGGTFRKLRGAEKRELEGGLGRSQRGGWDPRRLAAVAPRWREPRRTSGDSLCLWLWVRRLALQPLLSYVDVGAARRMRPIRDRSLVS